MIEGWVQLSYFRFACQNWQKTIEHVQLIHDLIQIRAFNQQYRISLLLIRHSFQYNLHKIAEENLLYLAGIWTNYFVSQLLNISNPNLLSYVELSDPSSNLSANLSSKINWDVTKSN